MAQPEITAPVDLCLPSGALNPAAVGWSRRALHRANLRTGHTLGRAATWSRTRRWEHWCLMTPAHVIALTVASMNLAGFHQVWVLDRRTGVEVDCSATTPLARGLRMPSVCGGGPVRAQGGGPVIAIDPTPGGTHLRAVTPRVRLDAVVARPEKHDLVGVVVPWSDRLFQYTVKDVGLPVAGSLSVDGKHIEFGVSAAAWAAQDFGRGRWPYSMTWNWGVGSGHIDGRGVGIQLGGKWTDGTGASENALVLDGRVHHIAEDLSWAYDSTDLSAPWFVNGERVDLRFQPVHERTATINLGVLSIRTTQCFGTWSGWATDDDAHQHRVDGLEGWVQEVHNRW